MYGSLSRLPLCRIIWVCVPWAGRMSLPGARIWTRPFRDAFRRRQGQYHHSHRSIFVRRFIFELAGRIIRFIEDNWNLGAELEIVPSMHWLARCSKCSTLIMSPKRNAFFSIRTQASLAGSNLKLASRVGVYLRRKRLLIDFAEIVCIYR
jgi:hypothetical protein